VSAGRGGRSCSWWLCQTLLVELEEFWAIVDRARATAIADGRWATADEIGRALTGLLAAEGSERILLFYWRFAEMDERADQWELCAACYLISGYLSDNTYQDFRAGIVGLGRTDFERVVADPDSLADLPIVAGVHDRSAPESVLHGESIHLAAAKAYNELADDDEAFWEALQTSPTPAEHGRGWSGTFGPEDGPEIPRRLPRLYAMFPRALARS
jgi:hypothetical protein